MAFALKGGCVLIKIVDFNTDTEYFLESTDVCLWEEDNNDNLPTPFIGIKTKNAEYIFQLRKNRWYIESRLNGSAFDNIDDFNEKIKNGKMATLLAILFREAPIRG